MGRKYADEAEQVARQANALRREHEDLAPHAGCSCRLCLLLREVARLAAEELKWTRERVDLKESIYRGEAEVERLLAANRSLRERLQFDPGGSDKIDELDTLLQLAEAMALVLSHEGRIEKLDAEIARLRAREEL